MKRKVLNLGALAVITLLWTGVVRADQRSYAWTYEYLTLPPGEAELEYYYTISAPDSSSMRTNVTTEHKFEYEVGMTEHFDFAIYQIFEQTPEEGLRYEAFQLRARYRFGQKGEHIVDSLAYLEYEGVPDFTQHAVEAKWILAKDLGRFHVALNPILEFTFGDEDKVVLEYAAGASHRTSSLLSLGLEARGGKDGHYVGPVISHGKGRFWATLGSAFSVGSVASGEPEFQMRMLLGLGL